MSQAYWSTAANTARSLAAALHQELRDPTSGCLYVDSVYLSPLLSPSPWWGSGDSEDGGYPDGERERGDWSLLELVATKRQDTVSSQTDTSFTQLGTIVLEDPTQTISSRISYAQKGPQGGKIADRRW